ncbi:methylated-DNA-[protein]-cysteine S-methyltransferase [Sphingobium faniae]|nr:methylated-DNA-[protein]-cysteine S-methyltransferase [Sphingobium faniae]
MLLHKVIASPVGPLKLVASDYGLKAVLWDGDDPRRVPLGVSREAASAPFLVQAEVQLDQYFAGERRSFQLPLDVAGTAFQQAVWRALLDIRYGETRSYEDLARGIGRPNASRAVGAANGRNPLSIIVPCHRVLGKNGALAGFAGGLRAKSYLLDLERRCGDSG